MSALGVQHRGPLSPLQESMLFQSLLAPGSGVNVEQVVCRLAEPVDAERLERAWRRAAARHDVLRTRFRWEDGGECAQEVLAAVGVEVERRDCAGLGPSASAERLERWLADDRVRGFDLARAPAMRLALFRLAPDEHVLVWSFHHALLDGRSVGHVLHEVFALYEADADGREAALPDRPPFHGHVAWLRGRDPAPDEAYWSARLRGVGQPERVREIRRAPRNPATEPAWGDRELILSADDTAALRAFEAGRGVWLNTLVQGAWALLLGRYTGSGEAVFGVVRGGRAGGAPGAEEMVGLLINTVPVRVPLPAGARTIDWLDEIAEATAALLPHEHAALADIRRWSGLPADAELFDSVVNFQPRPFDASLRALGGAWEGRNFRVLRHPGLPLTLEVSAGERLRARLHYDADLFDAEAADRILGHFAGLLRAIAAEPEVALGRLPLVADEEREALLAAGRATRTFPVAERIERRFARRAAERPDAPALTFGGATLTYRELDARADRLARRLRALGVGPETRVAVALERSAELVVALLAVLKAGGAYVPLDPAYPADRIAFVLEDAAVPVLVTASGLLPRLPAFAGTALCVDDDADDASHVEIPTAEAGPDSLAYVIYTSGSTGKPKGVQVTHANVARLFDATDEWFGFGAEDVWTLFHSAAFDFSVWEIWGALLYGGRLVVVPFDVSRSPEDFHRLLADEGVTVLNQTPSAFKQLVEADRVSGLPADALRLRFVVFGGEALDPQALRPWMDRHGDARPRLVNMYGITETTVHVTYRPVTRADVERGGSPIGIPIHDLSLYLLDANLIPVPVGVPGEIFVGGAGVARGYLNRPELTAERFLRDPFSADPAARLYRSGDLALRRPGGEVEYLGRGDQQVKVRGFRIETGEIEAALAAHPAVAGAAVVAREDAPGDRRLVAYVVARAGHDVPAAAELRAHAAASLPDYMVPAAFVALDALPLTENGKLDRRALPAPEDAADALAAAPYAAPRTPAERALAEAWSEVLGVERVGIDDNYFALGGDSIRSVRLVAAARQRGVPLSVAQLYRCRTIRELAPADTSADSADSADSVGSVGSAAEPFALLDPAARSGLPDDVEDAYPASRVQLAMLYHTQRDPASLAYLNLNAYRVHTRWDEAAMREALRRVAARHPVLRTSFDLAASPEPVQRVHREVTIPLEVADLRHLDAAEQDAWTHRDKARGFDWTAAPLLRFHAHRLTDDVFRLVLAEHHAVLDGWSVASLMTELLRLYVALRDGAEDDAGPPPAARFRDFVALEREAIASAESRAFWRRVMDDAPVAALPPREGSDAPRADEAPVLWIDLPEETARGLKRAADSAGVPLKTVLLAAHLRVLALLGGGGEVVTGYVTSGRPETADGERVLGLFLNTVPLRVDLSAGSWLELVRRAWAAEEAVVPHRRFPLAEIVREAGGHAPFQAVFNFNHFHVYDALAADGVRLEGDRPFQKTEVPLLANALVNPATGALRLRLDHDPARLGEAQVRSIGAWYARALAALAADPEARWDADALLDADEVARLRRWGAGPAADCDRCAVHHLFERQALRTPDAVAVVHEGAPLTYRELNERANRLAHALRRRGVGPEAKVGLHLDRSPDLPAAMLAVLKAGGAYVPLDPAYPAERLDFMLADAGVAVLLTQSAILSGLPATAAEVIAIDRQADEIAGESAENLDGGALPENAAWVIFTSGSTGRPKGVQIEHRSAVVLLHWLRQQIPDEERRSVLGSTSISFDVSVAEIFGTLCWGGTLHLVENALSLANLPTDAGILRASMVPSAAAELVRMGKIPPSLRSLGLGGEAVPPSLARQLHALGTLERVENLYGPTEDTTYSTFWIIPPDVEGMRVGSPVAGTQAYVLDARLALVPAGTRGELYLAGDGLARGYLNRPALTAERFVPCPFGPPGSRMYRVGDQVRWTADGELEYLDRLDNQVKVRGFRVETGEVEEALRAHPAVAGAAVVAREAANGNRQLVAYVVSAADSDASATSPAALRAHLAARLPGYMVPAMFVALDALPLNANGKLDRRALPAPDSVAVEAEAYIAPRLPAEEELAAVWSEVLGVERVGIDDNYFALGGDSIRSVRLVAAAGRRGLSVSVPLLHRHPSVRALAAALEPSAEPTAVAKPSLEPFALLDPAARSGLPEDVEDAYPASRVQLGMLYHTERDPDSLVYHEILNYRVRTAFDEAALREALRIVAARHPLLRTSFDLTASPEPIQRVHREVTIPLEVADLRHLDAAEQDAWVEREKGRGFDWRRPPLLRVHAHRLTDDVFRLVLVEHHAVLDGWSVASLMTELLRLYVSLRDGTADPTGAPPATGFRDFVALEREAVASEASRAFWRRVVDDAPAAALPPREGSDAPRPDDAPFLWVDLPDETARGLRRAAERAGVPLKTVLLAAHLRVLALLGGGGEVVSGYVTSGRPETEDGERVLGLFLNTVPLRVDAAAGTWLELVRRTWAAEEALLPHRRFPLAEIVREAGGGTLFEASFNFVHFHVYDALAADGVRLEADRSFLKTEVPLLAHAMVNPATGALRLRLEHDPARLGEAQMRAIGGWYARALAALAADPEARCDADGLLDADEVARLRRWGAGPAAEQVRCAVHHLFERQALHTPDAIAVVHEGMSLTYRELNERTNRLAHALRRRGVGPEAKVGLHLTRSPDLLAAMLAVLKAGGAYVPLDPAYPAERLAFMADDADVAVLLTQDILRAGLPTASAAEVIAVDGLADEIAAESAENPEGGALPENAAWVIYTSGSTGRPKGVQIEHRSAVVFLHWLRGLVPDEERRAVLGSTSISFDVSVAEIFGTLCWGGTLHLVENALSLASLPADAGILRAGMVPSAAAELVRMGKIPPSLKSLALAGEAVPVSLARQLHALGTLERVENLYGPTEDTTYSTFWLIPPGAEAMRIGTPVAGTQAYVLDARLALVPPGTRGELYLAGEGLARGYLNRPALTAERFLPCPFGPPGSRMYRVGDQVRWTADGELEYLDRLDNQVKVRGFRVEPGEIEEALRIHPHVADAVVVARPTEDGGAALVAYVTPADASADPAPRMLDDPALPAALRAHLAASLPSYMVPGAVVVLGALPRTPNGKIDRRALPAPARDARAAAASAPRTETERRVARVWAEVLGVGSVGVDENFFDAGGDSLRLFRLHALLGERLGAELRMVDFFRLPTVRLVAARLDGAAAEEGAVEEDAAVRAPAARDGRVAVVGMAGRFPGAAGPAALWEALRGGADRITRFTPEELRAGGVRDEVLARPDYVPARGALEDIDRFDAAFFGVSPRDAEILDPQQRIFLECAWEAMEDAGRDPRRVPGRVGVFAGAAMSTYLDRLRQHPTLADEVGAFTLRLANDKDFVSTRTAYELGLRGPAVTVQTACSTSLVAVHLACRSLLGGECDMALAGGVSAVVPQTAGYLYQKGGIASPDGRCRAFDAEAEGTVPGSGCGVVALKRLDDALADGDTIHAVILGSAINNDGDRRVGFTAPGVEGQAGVIRAAHAAAGVDPSTIGYVEAHGTGTALGDSIEVAALADAFGPLPAGSVALGSLKPNVGHLDTAAGVAGLIKAVLALRHAEVPPTLHFQRANPQIGFERTPFFVPTELRSWARNGTPRRAGVSSFGIGGTNAHVVLEEAPQPRPADPAKPWQLLLLSARSPEALENATDRLAAHLADHPELPLADVAFTLREGRRAFPHRRAVVVREGEDAPELIRGAAPDRLATGRADEVEPSAVFLFPGVGEQYPGMGRGLYETEPVFRAAVDQCADILRPRLGFDLRETLFAADDADRDEAGSASGKLDLRRMLGRAPVSEAAARLARTEVAQPVAFVVGYALAKLWESWGIRPAAVLGHSLGEYTAACVAGVFSLEDALELVAARARVIQALPGGAMLAVPLAPDALAPYLADDVALAAVNAPELCVLSGSDEAIARVEQKLSVDGHAARRLAATHAFHSPLMRPVADEVRALAARMRLSEPRTPMISNVTGTWLSAAQATDPGYWAEHLLGTVNFARGAATLLEDSARVWVEAGPGGSLGTFVRQQARSEGRDAPLAVASLPHAAEGAAEPALLLASLGRLWTAGVRPDWAAFRDTERRRRVPLPTYPFERTRHWVDLPDPAPVPAQADANPSDVADWFHLPAWRRTLPAAARADAAARRWLLLADAEGTGDALAERLRALGGTVDVLPIDYAIDPAGALAERWAALEAEGSAPDDVVHLWSISGAPEEDEDGGGNGVRALLTLAGKVRGGDRPVRIRVVASHAAAAESADEVRPGRALLTALCRAIGDDETGVRCRMVDVPAATEGSAAWRARLERVEAELLAADDEPAVALRGAHRYVRHHEPAALAVDRQPARGLRERGVYLVTGGLGEAGLRAAGWLARLARARLVLVDPTPFPPRASWDALLAANGDQKASAVVRRIREMEARGSEILIAAADSADADALRAVLHEAEERFGPLHGVVHAADAEPNLAPRNTADLTRAEWEAWLRPARGARVLERVLPDGLDFCLLLSSLPVRPDAAHAAADAWLEAFALAREGRTRTPWISLRWDTLAAASTDDAGTAEDDAAEAFRRALTLSTVPRLIVSAGDPDAPGARQTTHPPIEAAAAPPAAEAEEDGRARLRLDRPYAPPRDEVERALAAAWQRLLGVERVGIHDDFFRLGGHSLLGIRLMAAVREELGADLAPQALFRAPTVAGMAAAVVEARLAATDQATLEAMLADVRSLSPEELRHLLEHELHNEGTAGR